MFTDVLADLKKGMLPADLAAFKKRFHIAMIKKTGVLKLPYHFWSNDPKINPSSDQLAWVALILEDSGALKQVEGMVAQEIAEKLAGKKAASASLDSLTQKRLKEITNKFLGFAPNKSFRQLLAGRVSSCPWFDGAGK